MARGAALLSVLSALAGCGPGPVAPGGTSPRAIRQTEQSHLLLFPVSNGASLLGRPVGMTADGAWTIGDERLPGCEVRARSERAAFDVRKRVELSSLTSIAAGYAHLIGFESRFGRVSAADLAISNTQVLRADVRGTCGDVIVDSVFVGRGTRTLLVTDQVAVSGHAAIGLVTPEAGLARTAKVVDETTWEDEQSYGFTFRRVTNEASLELRLSVPATVQDGENVRISIEANRRAFLVVYYVDSAQHGDVLWPSQEEPEPMVEPGRPAALPSRREREQGIAIKAQLRKPGAFERETIVAYAFTEKADFMRFKPGAGGSDADGTAYAAAISGKLSDVPLNRWSRGIAGYVIQPR
jgi:hypothetical protein